MPDPTPAAEDAASLLRERALLILSALERAEPSPIWAGFRSVVPNARRLADLRSINRDLRGSMAGLSPQARAALRRELRQRFGPDTEFERDRQVVAKVRARGKIRSEREYRVVQGYADSIAGDPDTEAEYLALGALLDDFMAGS